MFSPGTCVALAESLSHSQNRVFVLDALRIMKSKLPEVAPSGTLGDIPEETIPSILQLISSSEELSSPEVSGLFKHALKNYPLKSNIINTLLSTNNSNSNNTIINNKAYNEKELNNLQKFADTTRQKMNLAFVLQEYGYQCSSTIENFRKTLQIIGIKIDEEQAANIIIHILPRTVPSTIEGEEKIINPWNLEIIADVLAHECKGFNWTKVCRFLDSPNLYIRSESDFHLLTRIIVRISGNAIPAVGLLDPWENKNTHLAILTLSANAPRSIIDFQV